MEKTLMISQAIDTDSRPRDLRSVDGALVVNGNIRSTAEVSLVTLNDLTASYAQQGAVIDVQNYNTLGLKIAGDVGESLNASLKIMGALTAGGTPFELDTIAVKALWTTGPSDFTKYFEFSTGALPFVTVNAIAGTLGTAVAAFLTGGTNAEDAFATWAAISDGSFKITVDGVVRNITAIDFTGCGTMNAVAAKLQADIRTATGGSELCVWSTDHFVITSGIKTRLSQVSVASAVTPASGTDISVVALMDAVATNATATAAVLVGALSISYIKG
jgi:hypothetical protein